METPDLAGFFHPIQHENLARLGCTLPPKSLGLPISQLLVLALQAESYVLSSQSTKADQCDEVQFHLLNIDEDDVLQEVQKCESELRILSTDLAVKRQTLLKQLLLSAEHLSPEERERRQRIQGVYCEHFVKKKLFQCLRQGVENGPGTRIVCEVCFTGEDTLMTCRSCNVRVHKHCYGLSSVAHLHPDWWHCDRCVLAEARPRETFACVLCPVTHGAVKRVGTTSDWVHLVCVLWLGLRVASPLSLQPLRIDPSVFQTRVLCDICHIPHGACMKCVKCTANFHPLCAFAQGLFIYCSLEAQFAVFCLIHTPPAMLPRVRAIRQRLEAQVEIDSSFEPSLEPAGMIGDKDYVSPAVKARHCGYCLEVGHTQSKIVRGRRVIVCPTRRKAEGLDESGD